MEVFECQIMFSLCKSDIVCIISPKRASFSKDKSHIFLFLCLILCSLHSGYSAHVSRWQILIIQNGNNYELSLWKPDLWEKAQENNRIAKGRKTWMKTRNSWVTDTHTSDAHPKVHNSGKSINSNHFLSWFPPSFSHTFCSGIKARKAFIKQHEIHLTVLWMH